MSKGKYIVLKAHESSYPEPITFEKGAALTVGEKYDGNEDWENWVWCHAYGQKPGWVPGELIELIDTESARALDSYTARELTVGKGQKVRVQKILNGWAWCELDATDEAGWVPLSKLSPSKS